VDEKVDLDHAIAWIASCARGCAQKYFDELIVLCHGFESNLNATKRICTATGHGGFGLSICDEGLRPDNAGKLRAWRDPTGPLIRQITIYACATADSASCDYAYSNDPDRPVCVDGPKFAGKIATTTGAWVVAARDTQLYVYNDKTPIDFGQWEGPVYLFSPNTGSGVGYSPKSMYDSEPVAMSPAF
jgi:hypothetical protein